MSRILLLCFIHGFKGSDNTFKDFPEDLKRTVSRQLPDHRVESVVYPKYETKGELAECSQKFLEWLKERVMELRKAHLEKPWPPNDRNVGVILIAHSMGGFVAADSLFLTLNERHASKDASGPLFPNIQGILAFDTPFNGLSRSMFVYGAFSNYQKVSSVFNWMTALSAGPAALGKLAMTRAAGTAPRSAGGGAGSVARNPGWKAWQLIAVRTGTVGAIAAGGVAAYVHRKEIIEGVRSMRNLNKQTIVEGYQSGVDAMGQGLAYINRGNVGESFAWLSDHFTFVGALLKQTELNRRLERMAALRGIGVQDFYASLGKNGYWSGGYFVPERTFCAVPQEDQQSAAAALFQRWVVKNAEDELQAHVGMFQPQKNAEYDEMTSEAAKLVARWFSSEEELVDDPKFAQLAAAEPPEEAAIKATDEGVEIAGEEKISDAADAVEAAAADEGQLPDESPVDIAAAATLVPLPDDAEADEALAKATPEERAKANYMRHLFEVAQQAGTGLKVVSDWSSQLPSRMQKLDGFSIPSMSSIPKPSMPSMPTMPTMSSIPGMNIFSKKEKSAVPEEGGEKEEKGAVEENKDEQKAETATEPPVETETREGTRGEKSATEETTADKSGTQEGKGEAKGEAKD